MPQSWNTDEWLLLCLCILESRIIAINDIHKLPIKLFSGGCSGGASATRTRLSPLIQLTFDLYLALIFTTNFGFCHSVCILDCSCQSKSVSSSSILYVKWSFARAVRSSIHPKLSIYFSFFSHGIWDESPSAQTTSRSQRERLTRTQDIAGVLLKPSFRFETPGILKVPRIEAGGCWVCRNNGLPNSISLTVHVCSSNTNPSG